MKKSFIILSLACLSYPEIKAQETGVVSGSVPFVPAVELGFRFMPTFSSFNMQTSSGGTVKGEVTLGYGIGGVLGLNFSNHVGIQGEVIYNSLSQKYKDQALQHQINVRYINIPVLLSLNTGKSNPVNLNIVAGPQFGLNVGSSISGSNNTNSDTLVAVLATKKSDFGFAYGAGLGFALNSARNIYLDLGFRGVYGFVNVSSTDRAPGTNTYYILDDRANIKTHAGYIGLSFLF